MLEDIQSAGGHNHYHLCRICYTFGLDTCMYRGELNETKLVLASLLQLLNDDTTVIFPQLWFLRASYHQQILAVATESQDTDFGLFSCPQF